jgi:hypothetical protein
MIKFNDQEVISASIPSFNKMNIVTKVENEETYCIWSAYYSREYEEYLCNVNDEDIWEKEEPEIDYLFWHKGDQKPDIENTLSIIVDSIILTEEEVLWCWINEDYYNREYFSQSSFLVFNEYTNRYEGIGDSENTGRWEQYYKSPVQNFVQYLKNNSDLDIDIIKKSHFLEDKIQKLLKNIDGFIHENKSEIEDSDIETGACWFLSFYGFTEESGIELDRILLLWGLTKTWLDN